MDSLASIGMDGFAAVIPVLILLSFIGLRWQQKYLASRWRMAGGITSLAVLMVAWLLFVGPLILAARGIHLAVDNDRWGMAVAITSILGSVMSVASLRCSSKFYALGAGLLQASLAATMRF